MGLSMSQRHAVTKAIATRYKRADKAGKGTILDELCATTGWHRNHARKALGQALRPKIVRPRKPRAPLYGPEVIGALRFCWAVLGAPTGKRLAPSLDELVPTQRRFGELDVSEEVAVALMGMWLFTIPGCSWGLKPPLSSSDLARATPGQGSRRPVPRAARGRRSRPR